MIENALLFALIEGRGAPMSMNHPEQSITRSVSNTPFNSMGDIGDFSEIIKISYNTTIYGSEGVLFQLLEYTIPLKQLKLDSSKRS